MPGVSKSSPLLVLSAVILIGYLHIATVAGHGVASVGFALQQELGISSEQELPEGQRIQALAAYVEKGLMSRRKRGLLFSSGVRLCTQDTVEQAYDNHLKYFYLRACQETVWEAFKIFWDRLPVGEEHEAWVNRCMNGSVNVVDIASYFSLSQEHIDLIQSRVAMSTTGSELASSRPKACSPQRTPEDEDPASIQQEMEISVTPPDLVATMRGEHSPGTSWVIPDEAPTSASTVLPVQRVSLATFSGSTTFELSTDPTINDTQVVNDILEGDIGAVQGIEENVNAGRTVWVIAESHGDDVARDLGTAEVLSDSDAPTDRSILEVDEEVTTEAAVEVALDKAEEGTVEVVENLIPAFPLDTTSEVSTETASEDMSEAGSQDTSRIYDNEGIEEVRLADTFFDIDSLTSSEPTVVIIHEADDEGLPEFQEISPHTSPSPLSEAAEAETLKPMLISTITQVIEIPLQDVEEVTTKFAEDGLEVALVVTSEDLSQAGVGDAAESLGEAEAELTSEVVSELTADTISSSAPVEENLEVHAEVPPQVSQDISAKNTVEADEEVTITTPQGLEITKEDLDDIIRAATEDIIPEVTEEEPTGEEAVDEGENQSGATEKATPVVAVGDTSERKTGKSPEVVVVVDLELQSEASPGMLDVETTVEDIVEVAGITPVSAAEEVVQIPQEVTEEVTPGGTLEESPEAAVEIASESLLEVAPESALEVTPTTVLEVILQASQEAAVDISHTVTPGTGVPLGPTTKAGVATHKATDTTTAIEETNDERLGNQDFDIEDKENTFIGNEIDDGKLRPPKPMKDQVVELSIRLKGETYNNALRDPSSSQYKHLAKLFTEKIEDAFERLPGFKNVFVVEFRPQKDLERGLVVAVHYAVTLEVDAAGVSSETMDFITFQSNMVEKSFPSADERPTVVYTITDFRNYITEALHKDNFMVNSTLDVDPDSLRLENLDSLIFSTKPTIRPADSSDDMDNILAAEKPLDIPGPNLDRILKKEDFLFDPAAALDPWKGLPQPAVASENDVLALNDSAAPPTELPGESPDLGSPQTTSSPNTENNGNIEEEGFIFGNTFTWPTSTDTPYGDGVVGKAGSSRPSPGESQTAASLEPPVPEPPGVDKARPEDDYLDSGSGFSGDDQDERFWPLRPASASEPRKFFKEETTPPQDTEPDLSGEEEDEEDEREEEGEIMTQLFTESPKILDVKAPAETVLASEVPKEDIVMVEEHFLDRVPITPNILTNPAYIPATQAPLFWTIEPLTVELSMQTEPLTVEPSIQMQESSGVDDNNDHSEAPAITAPLTNLPVPDADASSASVLEGSVEETEEDHAVLVNLSEEAEEDHAILENFPGEAEKVHAVLENLPEATTPQLIEMAFPTLAFSSPEDVASIERTIISEPVVSKNPDPDTNVVLLFTESPAFADTMQDPVYVVISDEAPEMEVLTGKPVLMVPVIDVKVLEEQGTGVVDPAVLDGFSEEDIAEDEILFVSTTTSVLVNSGQGTPLSAEKESPFMRVSDTVPEEHEEDTEWKEVEESVEASMISLTGPSLTISAVVPSHQPTLRPTEKLLDAAASAEGISILLTDPVEDETDVSILLTEPVEEETDASRVLITPASRMLTEPVEEETDGSSMVTEPVEVETDVSRMITGPVEEETDVSSTLTSIKSIEEEVEINTPQSDINKLEDDALIHEIQPYEPDSSSTGETIGLTFDVMEYDGDYGSSADSSVDLAMDNSVSLPGGRGQALMVFFSLRVTNMKFSQDLFNKSSTEYKDLEQRFIELLVPYLQSNLSNFQNLEILNFRNGSVVVNSRLKFGRPVPQRVADDVYVILEDFCSTAYQTMNLAIDKYSLDVESGDHADPCKFQACNEFSRCMVNPWSGEAECVCNAGYVSVDGLPCQSICHMHQDYCLNDGKCDIIPGKGAICRCLMGENWWYRGEHCEEYVSEMLVIGIAMATVSGFLLLVSGVTLVLSRMLRGSGGKDLEGPLDWEDNVPYLERVTRYNPMFEGEAPPPLAYNAMSGSQATPPITPYYRRLSTGKDLGSSTNGHNYEHNRLSSEDVVDRLRIVELYKDRQFADIVQQHHEASNQQASTSTTT